MRPLFRGSTRTGAHPEGSNEGVPNPPEETDVVSRMGRIRLSLGMGGRESYKAQYASERSGKEGAAGGLENARRDSNAS
jgi:hypothetical protein